MRLLSCACTRARRNQMRRHHLALLCVLLHAVTGHAVAQTAGIQPPVRMHGKQLPWEHEIQVALPPKHTTAPGRDVFNKANEALDEFTKQSGIGVAERAGGAPHFLSFLVDEVRPALAKKYRMADQNILFGHSSGGTFCTYALLARPAGFQKYICSSAGLYGGNGYFFELENRYARTHDDLKAEVFFAAGEGEVIQPTIAGIGLVSSTSRMAEVLTERKYPSLELSMRIFPAEDHATTLPRSLSWGLRALSRAD